MATLKELTHREDRLAGGHRLCAGCGASIAMRQIMLASDSDHMVVGCTTGCLQVSTSIYPYTSWRDSYIHNAFENSAATVSGVEAAYTALRRSGKIPADKKMHFMAVGGDGATYDIGFQSLSGAMERGHNMVYVCYDNGAYMNTGIQRSSATPRGAWTTTSEVGSAEAGKRQARKDIASIMAAHGIPYVANASISHWKDLTSKAEKAFNVDGPAFLSVLAPCPRGWRSTYNTTVEIAKIGVQTGFWPLFEVENGVWRQTVKVTNRKPIEEFLKPQGRFKHLFKPENAGRLAELQADVETYWDYIQRRCEAGV